MLKRLRQFLFYDLEDIKLNLRLLVERRKEESTESKLMRHLLGSIDLSDLAPLDFKNDERKDFAASLAIVFPKLSRIMRQLIEDHKNYALTHDGNPEFQKGTLNGFYLALEEFENWRAEHLENTKPKESFDKYATLPELLERVSRASGSPLPTPGEKVD